VVDDIHYIFCCFVGGINDYSNSIFTISSGFYVNKNGKMTASFRKVISDYKAFILDMDGTLYYQIPVRICMAVELFFYYICHLNKISDLFLIYAYRKNSELGILQKPNSNITV
jgi:hypothetical protein